MPTLTYKYRIKDNSARKTLRRHTYAVNQVWNYCVAQQQDVQDRYRAGAKPRRWASHFDLQRLCKGVGKELGLHQQSVGGVCRTFTQSRDKLKHAPRFRSSYRYCGLGRQPDKHGYMSLLLGSVELR